MRKSENYTLLVLAAIFAINNLDRHILSITLNQIGGEFNLTDTQLGLLSGLMFVVVYVLFGFPIAKLAARGNRRNIIAASAVVWSVMTIAMAGAQNFTQIALARLGVGIGEAGAVAPSHSLISDIYPPHRRTAAMASFAAGGQLGILLAFLIGGIIGQKYGWRPAFVIAGIPGLFLALILRFTISEPAREHLPIDKAPKHSLFLATLKLIYQDKGLFHAMCGISIVGIVTFGALAWNPTFIIRLHGLTQAQTGIFLALTIGVIGTVVTWFSGRLADNLGQKNPKWRMGIVILAIVISKPFIVGFTMMDNTMFALGAFVVSAAMAGVFWGPTFAFLHSRIPSEMRPMATAIFLFFFNLIGVGIGPTVIGFLSDTLFAESGARSVGFAILTVQVAGIWAAWHYWQVMREISSTSIDR